MRNREKSVKIRRLFILSLVLCSLFGLAAAAMQWYYVNRLNFHSSVWSESLELTPKKYITVTAPSLDVTVVPTDGESLVVEYVSASRLDLTETETDISLTERDSFTVSLFTAKAANYHLTLYLPAQTYKELYISTGVGNVRIGEIDTEFIEVSTKNGSITLSGCTSRTALRTLSGTVSLDCKLFISSAVIENQLGETLIKMPSDAAVSLDFTTATGSFTSSMFNKNYENERGALRIVRGVNRHDLSVATISGNLTIEEKKDAK